jgi:hypothetical protein
MTWYAELATTWGDNGMKRPTKDSFYEELAKYAFARPYFYYRPYDRRVHYRFWKNMWNSARERSDHYYGSREKYFGDLTVREVLRQSDQYNEIGAMFRRVGIRFAAIEEYYGFRPTEEMLHGKIFALTDQDVVDTVEREYVNVSTECYDNKRGHQVIHQIAHQWYFILTGRVSTGFVVGPRGSGKTFYALKQAAFRDRYIEKKEKHATLYVRPAHACDMNGNMILGSGSRLWDAHNLAMWIKDRLEQEYGRRVEDMLEMHLTIVLDEAGSSALNGFFEDLMNISACLEKLQYLARSVRLVLVDTKGESSWSGNSWYSVYRMRPWTRIDTEQVLQKLALDSPWRTGCFPYQKLVKNVISAIFGQSALAALAANAFTASSLLKAVLALTNDMPVMESEAAWKSRMSELAPIIIDIVLTQCMERFGLVNLDDGGRRRVAVSVLQANCYARRNPGIAQRPALYGLQSEQETECALALINNNFDEHLLKERCVPCRDIETATLMTSAHVTIVCYMLGVSAMVLSSQRDRAVAFYVLEKQANELFGE